MSKKRHPRDPAHPDFPHGTGEGYRLKCRCTPCGEAKRRKDNAYKLRKLHGTTNQYLAPPKMVAAARAKVTRLLAVPGSTRESAAATFGISRNTLIALLDTDRDRFRITVLRKILDGPNVVDAAYVAADDFALLTGQLRALGYSAQWQSEQTGVRVRDALHSVTKGEHQRVTRRLYDAILALHTEVGHTPATPENCGTPQSQITAVRRAAQRDGYYPPQYYDEAGNLDVASIPGHPVAVANDKADDLLAETYRLLRALDGRGTQLAADWLVPLDAEHRNLKLANTQKTIGRFHQENRTGSDMPGGLARRKHIRTVIEDYHDGAYGSPVAVALALGLWTLDHSHVYGLLLPARPCDKNKARHKNRPTAPHPGVAEAAELGHLNPLVAVPLEDTDEAAA